MVGFGLFAYGTAINCTPLITHADSQHGLIHTLTLNECLEFDYSKTSGGLDVFLFQQVASDFDSPLWFSV